MSIVRLMQEVRLTGVGLPLLLGVVLVAAAPAHAQVIHQVHVGGPDICSNFGLKPGCDKNFVILGLEFADGRATGKITDLWAGGGGYHARVDCVSVDGNDAWVSGVITRGSYGDVDLAGLPVITRVRDNGTSENDPPDETSWSSIGDDRSCLDQPVEGLPLFLYLQGQVQVR